MTLASAAPGYDLNELDLYSSILKEAPVLPAPVHAPIYAPAPVIKTIAPAPIYAPAPVFAPVPVIKSIAPVAPVVKAIAPATSYATFTQYHVSHPVVKIGAKKRGTNLYSPCDIVVQVKQRIYGENISITESEARISLENLLDHTAKCLAQVQSEVLEQCITDDVVDTDIVHKWGLDGCAGYRFYKNLSNNANYGHS
ncbi:hypothetical protein NQ314_005632 [Rhamnusium bicolor]|uniref:Uncharacterized protein n=1 Tax=Rhamnusium bicolor TaxID=1586634 RepID=A0AAV8ZGX5_9CUCU|nr:hypothetical protein NQ314_005632 [Rhamnusium bicolor]